MTTDGAWKLAKMAIASVSPGTVDVELDFSLINWTKDPLSHSLTDFSLVFRVYYTVLQAVSEGEEHVCTNNYLIQDHSNKSKDRYGFRGERKGCTESI